MMTKELYIENLTSAFKVGQVSKEIDTRDTFKAKYYSYPADVLEDMYIAYRAGWVNRKEN